MAIPSHSYHYPEDDWRRYMEREAERRHELELRRLYEQMHYVDPRTMCYATDDVGLPYPANPTGTTNPLVLLLEDV